ncbi:MAG: sulfatase-like hydrolase/transferase [Planctomycetota bacterium]|jgi:arylsulfatase A-like enzyme
MKQINRRNFLKAIGLTAASFAVPGCSNASRPEAKSGKNRSPNFIVIFCDDLGYGDIGCFGSKKHRTPNIDRMAAEGMRFTSFYVTSGVCTPSRSSLMTGCYPRRVNMHQSARGEWVLFPVAKKGLNPDEITIADVLKDKGYATACVGKWHLGDQPQFLPTKQGFDYYFGIPYSNDMGSRQREQNPPLPLMRNEKVIEAPADQNTLTKRYTEEVVKFIEKNKARPFFVYLPHTMPHNPVHSSDAFRGKSANGGFGDCVEEIDWSTGQILSTLKELGIDENTLVVFTSDNGASNRWGGNNLPLSGFKGSTMEGGMREPCVMRWPGKIPAGASCDELTCTMDLLPTFAKLAGTEAPSDRIIDGKDIGALVMGEEGAKTPHEAFYYYFKDQLQAVRSGKWKLHLSRKTRPRNNRPPQTIPAKLYDLKADIAEKNNVADKHPNIVNRLEALAQKAREDLGDGEREGANQRPAGLAATARPLVLE